MTQKPQESTALSVYAVPVFAVLAALTMAIGVSADYLRVWGAFGNWATALASFVIAVAVAPNFRTDQRTRVAAIIFFAALAASSLMLALGFSFEPTDHTVKNVFVGIYIATVAIRAFAVWEFVFGLKRSMDQQQRHLRTLQGRPEVGRRAGDKEHGGG